MKEKVLRNLSSHEHPLLILTAIVRMHSCCMCLCLQYKVLFYSPPKELSGWIWILALPVWANHVTSLYLGFHICKMETLVRSTSLGSYETKCQLLGIVYTMVLQGRLPGCDPSSTLVVLLLWKSCLVSLCFSFLICNKRNSWGKTNEKSDDMLFYSFCAVGTEKGKGELWISHVR